MTHTTNTNDSTEQKENRRATPLLADLELRDYFAAHATDDDICSAMERIPKVETVRDLGNGHKVIERGYPPNIRQMARYVHADAMLAERSKK